MIYERKLKAQGKGFIFTQNLTEITKITKITKKKIKEIILQKHYRQRLTWARSL